MAPATLVSRRSLRLRPAIVLVIVQWLLWAVVPVVAPAAGMIGMIGGLLCGVLIVVWWLCFSRAPWLERLAAIAFMVLAMIVTRRFVHESIAGAGMGRLLYVFSIPPLTLALVAGATIGSRLTEAGRRLAIAMSILLGCGAFTLLRTDGVSGATGSQMHWRWTPTAEQRLLAQAPEPLAIPSPPPAVPEAAPVIPAVEKPASPIVIPAPKSAPEWPGFRGPDRDGVVRGVRLETDWVKSPPVELWHRAIGPGWSSFAVSGDLLYTQEQRGEHEIVACYQVSTGKPVWQHRDAVRFYESNAGPGPRATPTLNDGRVYAFGATGILNALDAATGRVIWTRNVASETKTEIPLWAFSSSPVVTDDLVIVAAAGTLVAYDRASGNRRWTGPAHGFSYSSPHRAKLGGVDQILLLSAPGIVSVSIDTGTLLWEHAWDGGAITQPGFTADGDVLINSISMTGGQGIRRLAVSRDANAWKVEERWTSTGLKPYFNDFVVHKGHAYGFDGSILSAIDLTDGKRKWKGGRYGNGQLILLADQDALLVLSEEGELALVGATPDEFKEIARAPALEGKTWNHPVLVRDLLLLRNGEEMAAFRMKLAAR